CSRPATRRDRESHRHAELARARGAHATSARLRRSRFRAHAYRGGDAHAGGCFVRAERRGRMGALAGHASSRRVNRVSVPSVWQRRLWRDWGFAGAVCSTIARKPPELVQSHERLLCCDIYREVDGVHQVWLEERLRDESLLLRRLVEWSPYHRYVLEMERRLFASPSLRAVICNSKMVRDEIRERFGLSDEKLSVIYNAVDSDVFSPQLSQHRATVRAKLGVPENATVFLLVGSGYVRKGVAPALAALARLPRDKYLFVVGRYKARGRYKRLARELGIGHRVALLGAQDDPRPFYGAADAFVLPTLYDPC